MRTRNTTRRGKRGFNSSEARSEARIEERLDNQDANSDLAKGEACDCGETNMSAEVVCESCGCTRNPNS